jgi:hypothetical protein
VSADLKDPATLELIFHAALTARDFPAVEAALRLLAVADPARCRELIHLAKLALLVAEAL